MGAGRGIGAEEGERARPRSGPFRGGPGGTRGAGRRLPPAARSLRRGRRVPRPTAAAPAPAPDGAPARHTPRPRGPGSAALCWAKRAGPPRVRPACPAAGGLPEAQGAQKRGKTLHGAGGRGWGWTCALVLEGKGLALHQRRAGEADLGVARGPPT